MLRWLLATIGVLALAISSLALWSVDTTTEARTQDGTVLGLSSERDQSPNPEVIPGRYIVVLRESADPDATAVDFASRFGFMADVVYRSAITGFAGTLPEDAVALIRLDPRVLLVEPDIVMRALPQTISTGISRMDVNENSTASIDGIDNSLNIDIAILDTGIDTTHPDLRVVGGARFAPSWSFFCSSGAGSFADDNGHGTHVAGIAAARDNNIGVVGVAPGARLWAVKVLGANGSAPLSCVIRGVDWVTANAGTIEVANMSLGGGSSSALCTAIANSVAAGVIYAVAAGNEATNAQNSSPANCDSVITVSAIADFDGQPGGLTDQTVVFSTCTETEDDSFACFSNFGSKVDIAAPGVNILSTYKGGGYAIGSGTSMASPHVAGAVALFKLATGYSGSANGPAVVQAMTSAGYTVPQSGACGFTGDPDAFPEPLVYVGTSCSGTPPTPTPTPTPTPPPTPTPTPSPPAAPSNLTAANTAPGTVVLNWHDNSNNEDEFRIERSSGRFGTFTQIAVVGANATTFTNTGLARGFYQYRVRACNASGCSAYSNTASVFLFDFWRY